MPAHRECPKLSSMHLPTLHRLFFHAPRQQVKTQNGLRLVDYVFVKGSMSASILDVSIITFMPVGLHIWNALDQPSPFCTTLNPCFTLLESPRRSHHAHWESSSTGAWVAVNSLQPNLPTRVIYLLFIFSWLKLYLLTNCPYYRLNFFFGAKLLYLWLNFYIFLINYILIRKDICDY
jgi:hypothetical protein